MFKKLIGVFQSFIQCLPFFITKWSGDDYKCLIACKCLELRTENGEE